MNGLPLANWGECELREFIAATRLAEHEWVERRRAVADQKRIVWMVYGRAVANGTIVRPAACSKCGRRKARIDGHHEDYTSPLVVLWLCRRCHRSADMERRSRENQEPAPPSPREHIQELARRLRPELRPRQISAAQLDELLAA